MGKGGIPLENTAAKQEYKLQNMETAELRKWAKKYGMSDSAPREELIVKMNPYADGIMDKDRPDMLPLAPLPFNLTDIRNAIPAHCFKRNLWHSLYYLALDLMQIGILAYAATFIGDERLPENSQYVLWPLYIYAQGCVMTGVWVLSHECGHQSFSESEFWNNFFGTIFHSALLVPYHSWRITHGKHHNNTGSCENDEVFAPSSRSDWQNEVLRESPFAMLWGIFLMLTVGWMPGYLVFNITGPAKYRGKNVNHFSPSAVMFEPKEYWLIVQSDIAFFTVLGAVIYSIKTWGFASVFLYYLGPLMVTNLYLVLITYLQHTASYLPHFRGKEWTFLRGALCTVDRSFGVVLNHVFHHITDTHVCHHIFSKMPFYHAQEATEAIKKFIGPYYIKDDTPIATAVYRSFYMCQYVEDEGDTVFFKNKYD